MKEVILSRNQCEEIMYNVMVQAGSKLPRDVKKALMEALAAEKEEIACMHLSTTLENLDLAEKAGDLACADTGFPLFYIKLGDNLRIEGGFSTLYEAAKIAVEKATVDSRLRPTMVHPVRRDNPGNNVGLYLPKVETRFDPAVDGIEITAVPKGGGSEIFGTFYRMMPPADGMEGVLKFILDSFAQATYAGKVCPPAVIGVGIGGSSDICMKIAKEAAILRPIGSRHPDPEIADLEVELLDAFNLLGVGPMGCRGAIAALDVHIECAMTHTAALPVGFNAQCSICRRATARLGTSGIIDYTVEDPQWNYR